AGLVERLWVVLAIDPVGHARAVTHLDAEERTVPLALEDRGGRFVEDSVDVDDPLGDMRGVLRHRHSSWMAAVTRPACIIWRAEVKTLSKTLDNASGPDAGISHAER